ncbi:hypothetical protein HRI_002096500 [Hibiscus trionum]|uniref:PPPDE domain-containing protein n=1 Tax=Hibiscus trionum TaxID=183268 RepID=A0A9W7LZY2_HIBTR|nr:hypothetical protein HRI_002096500 [Hibiscus trionum]
MGKVQDSSKSNETKVILHVYDLTQINNYSYWFGLGIFHSGIEVHGKEYGFGAHDFSSSGVFQVEPKRCPRFTYRCSISFGTINMPLSEFRALIEKMASLYRGNSYNLIYKNCNHFTDDVVRILTGKNIPRWVNRLARIGALFSCLLPGSLQVTNVKVPDYETEDGTETLSTIAPCDSDELQGTLKKGGLQIKDNTEEEKLLLSPKTGNSDINIVEEAQRDSKEA